jgi:hypothetical protein
MVKKLSYEERRKTSSLYNLTHECVRICQHRGLFLTDYRLDYFYACPIYNNATPEELWYEYTPMGLKNNFSEGVTGDCYCGLLVILW